MLTYLVKPVLDFIHHLHKGCVIILATSCHIGRVIFLVLLKICHIISDTFSALIIIGEELYNFLCELNTSVEAVSHYVRTSANGGLNCAIEAFVVFCRHISKFFNNTKLHSKLLATKLGYFLCHVFDLLYNALLLIADFAWWSLTLLPRCIAHTMIAVGDFTVYSITIIRRAVVYSVTIVVEDIFRLTIAVVLVLVLWRNRRRLRLCLLGVCLYLKRMVMLCCRLLVLRTWLFHRRTSPGVVQRTTPIRSRIPRPSISPAISDKSVDPQQRCVVCRDRQKCVLLLPCKHLCLCEECADYMIFNDERQTCPLCRTSINHSMSVYI